MNTLKNKLGRKNGFTLVEMLIVVAIIAILIAISIPLINSALERARDSTDAANERSAKAEALVIYMGVVSEDDELNKVLVKPAGGPNKVTKVANASTGTKSDLKDAAGVAFEANYDAVNGCLTTDSITAYGKCTGCGSDYAKTTAANTGNTGTAGTNNHVTKVVHVAVDGNGIVTISWKTPAQITAG